ncbi:hypothetical protein RYX36_017660 [Vicia faba]
MTSTRMNMFYDMIDDEISSKDVLEAIQDGGEDVHKVVGNNEDEIPYTEQKEVTDDGEGSEEYEQEDTQEIEEVLVNMLSDIIGVTEEVYLTTSKDVTIAVSYSAENILEVDIPTFAASAPYSQVVVQGVKKDVETMGVDKDLESSDEDEDVEYKTDSSDDPTTSS